jgi:hypothetical protein
LRGIRNRTGVDAGWVASFDCIEPLVVLLRVVKASICEAPIGAGIDRQSTDSTNGVVKAGTTESRLVTSHRFFRELLVLPPLASILPDA